MYLNGFITMVGVKWFCFKMYKAKFYDLNETKYKIVNFLKLTFWKVSWLCLKSCIVKNLVALHDERKRECESECVCVKEKEWQREERVCTFISVHVWKRMIENKIEWDRESEKENICLCEKERAWKWRSVFVSASVREN